ncbi:MAG TPA: hypothetical protein VNT60_05965 [Deinococcales bacterium]|nr:hypothetical protein [Deinococcales bacterium]
MPIAVLAVDDDSFDAALERFALVEDELVERASLGREPDEDEVLDRYAFTGLVEALRSEEFEEDPLDTVQDLELEGPFATPDDAWEAVKDFYAERACLLLTVGEGEEFIVGEEIARRLGLLQG